MVQNQPPTAPSAIASPRLHLNFLDGLRGLTALYVTLSHAAPVLCMGITAHPHWADRVFRLLAFGHYAVAVFIVLSGFCLMLPVALSADRQLRGGWREYLSRRSRRILPPYYAALVLSMLAMPLLMLVKHKAGVPLTESDTLTADNILSHLLLVHNLSSVYSESIDGPLWSVATEWQIYFFLPFVLLPVWRRAGLTAVVAVAFVLGLGPHFLLPAGTPFSQTGFLSQAGFEGACPWYLGLFALGMTGAVVCTSRDPEMQILFKKAPWGVLTLVPFGLIGAGHFLIPQMAEPFSQGSQWYMDIMCGVSSTCLLILCGRRAQAGKFWLTGILQSPPAMALGAMSYSLYLMHLPLMQGTVWLLCTRHLPFGVLFAATFALVVPSIVGVCYLFHLVFERPFMLNKPRSEKAAEKAALLSPAP